MANRTGTYFAFDDLGETDPTKSDFRYYATVQGWDTANHIEFHFVDSHEKASSVRDPSKLNTLKASIRQRLADSKNMVVIISPDTRRSGSLLSWEIEQAVDDYKIPLIVAYTRYTSIIRPANHFSLWPITLQQRVQNGTVEAIHIPFKKDALFDAIRRFTVNGEKIGGPLVHYTREAQVNWGYIS
ncbi:TIR domain-containing protein [Solirhodobacter olei]|uniref:TIR domain-containing protein n=1 Tax=Solirhodobacter olei TaxID=2493082 RepID=UPI000FD7E2D1|nr:TIR domain-containing protein [Solirhodobacter olei]